MNLRTRRRTFRLVAIVMAMAVPVSAQHGAPASGEWPTYGGDLGGTKYSPLEQIDRDNFDRLEIVWRWRSADDFMSLDTPAGGEWRADSSRIFEGAQPPRPRPLA